MIRSLRLSYDFVILKAINDLPFLVKIVGANS